MRRRRRKEKVVIVGFALAVLLLGGVIVYVDHRPPALVMPSESAEMLALRAEAAVEVAASDASKKTPPKKRAVTASVRNAFPLLMQAHALIPERPKDLKDAQGQPMSGDLGALLRVRRADGDPELLGFLRACDDVVAMTRQALEAQTLVYPEISLATADDARAFVWLGNILVARALSRSRALDDAEAFRCLVDNVRLGLLLGRDGGADAIDKAGRVLYPWVGTGTSHLDEIVDGASSIELLRETLAQLLTLDTDGLSARRALEFDMRSVSGLTAARFAPWKLELGLDTSATYLFLKDLGMAESYVNARARWNHRKAIGNLRKYKDMLFAGADLPYDEYAAWRGTHWVHVESLSRDAASVFADPSRLLQNIKIDEAFVSTALRGIQLVVALEIHRREVEAYPRTLADLMPRYLPALPNDPYSGQPFYYRLVGYDYLLASAGSDAANDFGLLRAGARPPKTVLQDIVVHAPDLIQTVNSHDIGEWMVIGPFAEEDDPGASAILSALDTVASSYPMEFSSSVVQSDREVVSIRHRRTIPARPVVYALAYVYVPRETRGFMNLGLSHGNPFALWIGRQQVAEPRYISMYHDAAAPLFFETGTTPILVRLRRDERSRRKSLSFHYRLHLDAEAN